MLHCLAHRKCKLVNNSKLSIIASELGTLGASSHPLIGSLMFQERTRTLSPGADKKILAETGFNKEMQNFQSFTMLKRYIITQYVRHLNPDPENRDLWQQSRKKTVAAREDT